MLRNTSDKLKQDQMHQEAQMENEMEKEENTDSCEGKQKGENLLSKAEFWRKNQF